MTCAQHMYMIGQYKLLIPCTMLYPTIAIRGEVGHYTYAHGNANRPSHSLPPSLQNVSLSPNNTFNGKSDNDMLICTVWAIDWAHYHLTANGVT
jgi:hypothetical protein